MTKHDLVIRGGTLVDGTGAAPILGDLAIDGDRIAAIGSDVGEGRREIDARGHLITPGWVDIHAHYDAQATWDPMLSPASEHGVTTVVLGNCGVGFAPVRESDRNDLIDLMEAVEDIPGAAMHAGIQWEWETFPEFMDALERRDHAIDYGLQVPHCALRTYVMGDRGINNETATPDDIRQMKEIVGEALRAGALGFSTSRTEMHNTLKGEPVPGTLADHDELFGIGEALAEAQAGVFQMALTHREVPGEIKWMKELAKASGRIVTFNLQQIDEAPDLYKEALRGLDEARAEGITNLRGQFSGRPVGVMMGWETSIHPFLGHPEYVKVMKLPIEERLEALRRPEVKAKLLEGGELRIDALPKNAPIPEMFLRFLAGATQKMYPMGGGQDYEPDPSDSVAGRVQATDSTPAQIVYDALMDQDGQGLLYFPLFGYATSRFDAIEETMRHPQTGLSLADGGAHCGAICDAGTPTFMLMHWVRDRKRGERLPLEFIVKRQTSDTAHQYGLFDRGELKVGLKADVNIIDFDKLGLELPHMRHDFPAEGRRLYQGARGYRATIASGQVIFENGQATGALPGKLIRGAQPGL